ncbi:diacylglycerol kinase family protein [Neobacillus sp. OS1-32]|uniref:Diacylglycerol kinase family protein n=1 Tax=Neobacillus paridis TaxID=2803862 RepID=A0ABS1TKS5_9BACI|nr:MULTISPECIES: diacylglycerol kinase family protein [Neobacillus]MBL4951359.1 diacylglycerol kinase family protein [Neobacillus paridis]WML30666.1 diacylglycerol kinase family protein [Neobacillus sp. OS1-32]
MDLHDNHKSHSVLRSFSFAVNGLFIGLLQERNMRIHLLCSVVVVFISVYFSISIIEWIVILFAIGGMFALELLNSAIERVVDLTSPEYHPLAKQAKDMAAGAVLVYAVLSIIVGVLIYYPYIRKLFILN